MSWLHRRCAFFVPACVFVVGQGLSATQALRCQAGRHVSSGAAQSPTLPSSHSSVGLEGCTAASIAHGRRPRQRSGAPVERLAQVGAAQEVVDVRWREQVGGVGLASSHCDRQRRAAVEQAVDCRDADLGDLQSSQGPVKSRGSRWPAITVAASAVETPRTTRARPPRRARRARSAGRRRPVAPWAARAAGRRKRRSRSRTRCASGSARAPAAPRGGSTEPLRGPSGRRRSRCARRSRHPSPARRSVSTTGRRSTSRSPHHPAPSASSAPAMPPASGTQGLAFQSNWNA